MANIYELWETSNYLLPDDWATFYKISCYHSKIPSKKDKEYYESFTIMFCLNCGKKHLVKKLIFKVGPLDYIIKER